MDAKFSNPGQLKYDSSLWCFFPAPNNIPSRGTAAAVAAIIIFFNNEVIAALEPALYYWLEYLISIHL